MTCLCTVIRTSSTEVRRSNAQTTAHLECMTSYGRKQKNISDVLKLISLVLTKHASTPKPRFIETDPLTKDTRQRASVLLSTHANYHETSYTCNSNINVV
ncbi:hypothetical protein KP79_PYT09411 [Mizuhopecten yessoensis]|uniref:Uncharacterized protein n=1 Tax=Mizuhopecten yessoensis TaxID=6573 RepID=A0A210QXC4_MIZYE|nr:hypothetical protein KP79_PYT09411 [Mizuhopecten yessoensis]